MPIYFYHCSHCDCGFEKFHSMKEILSECFLCGASGSLIRIPQMPSAVEQKTNIEKKPGEITKKFIEEAREDIKNMKEEMCRERDK